MCSFRDYINKLSHLLFSYIPLNFELLLGLSENSYCNSVLNRMPILKHSTLIIYGSRVVTYNPKVLIKLFTRGTAMTKFHFIPSRPLSYVVVNTYVSRYIQTLRYNLNLPTGYRSQSSSLFGINNFIVGPWWW